VKCPLEPKTGRPEFEARLQPDKRTFLDAIGVTLALMDWKNSPALC
jgi:hypothetical protein